MSDVEVAAALGTALGESPVWDVDDHVLHLVDIYDHTILRLRPDDGSVATLPVDGTPSAIALRQQGGYIAAVDLGFVTIGTDGSLEPIATVPTGDRMNDGKCDPRGRFLAGTMDHAERPGGAGLYQLDPDGEVTELLGDVALSNGLDWSPSGQILYYVDTSLERIDRFDYDVDTGRIEGRRPFADLRDAPGRPDGLTVDADGGVWVAVARAGRVQRYDPGGHLDQVIEFPTAHVTSCTFGGTALDELYVTSSRDLLPKSARERDPIAGAVFVVTDLGVHGRPPSRCSR